MAEDIHDTPRPLAEISHGPSAFEAFLDRNQKGMVVAAILLALAGGAVIVYRGMKQAAAEAAGMDLSKAATVADFQAVTKNHPDSPAAGSAQVLLADKQWSDGDQDGAIETLRAFIAANPEHPALPSAKASLATRLLQQGKDGDAEPLFRDLADGSGSKALAPYALINLGDIAKKAGKLDEAEASYKRVQEQFSLSPFADTAAKHLRLVNFKMPAEIEAPPAAVPAPGAPGTPGAPETGKVEMPDELKDNPLGAILGEAGPAVPPAPVEEEPAPAPAPAPEQPQTPPPAQPEGTPPSNGQ
jgi:tetratricopeptide (TPR) repeat protein